MPILNAAGPWTWHFRDRDSEGFYWVTSSDNGRTRLRIYEEDSGFILEITLYPSDTRTMTREALRDIVGRRLLPSIGARNIREV